DFQLLHGGSFIDSEEDDDGDITDPELIAEKEYALEHGSEFDMNFVGGGMVAMAIGGGAERKYLVLIISSTDMFKVLNLL
uniref:Peptidylprolyl isomerase n=1 Tax=Loa loa TaxID=7209 RepID=A0A1I7VEF8_LOALO